MDAVARSYNWLRHPLIEDDEFKKIIIFEV